MATTLIGNEFKPLVLIVRSDHFQQARNIREAHYMLKSLNELTYIRDVFICLASSFLSTAPGFNRQVNFYADGAIEEECDSIYNPQMEKSLEGFIAIAEGYKQKGLPVTPLGFPPAEVSIQTILKPNLGYLKNRKLPPGLLDEVQGLTEEQKRQISEIDSLTYDSGLLLGAFELIRISTMLGLPRYYGARIKICPGEVDIDLSLKTMDAQQKGDLEKVELFAMGRNFNIYHRVHDDLMDADKKASDLSQAINAILYFGTADKLEPFMKAEDLDVAWVNIFKMDKSAVIISGTVPYMPVFQDEATSRQYFEQAFLHKRAPGNVFLDLQFRPQQLKTEAAL